MKRMLLYNIYLWIFSNWKLYDSPEHRVFKILMISYGLHQHFRRKKRNDVAEKAERVIDFLVVSCKYNDDKILLRVA